MQKTKPMTYKGYLGSIEFDEEHRLFYGQFLFIRALVSYEATDAEGLVQAFHEAVDDYLAHCQEQDIEPERPFKGSFNVRTGPELHRRAAVAAHHAGTSLNAFVAKALQSAVDKEIGQRRPSRNIE
jgi:predicted HicB family RNase H-like nuclease